LEWLKSTRWDGKLPLVTGGAGGQGVTPFIEIPTARSDVAEEPTQGLPENVTSGVAASSILNNRSTSQQQ
jgi:prohibitin 2